MSKSNNSEEPMIKWKYFKDEQSPLGVMLIVKDIKRNVALMSIEAYNQEDGSLSEPDFYFYGEDWKFMNEYKYFHQWAKVDGVIL